MHVPFRLDSLANFGRHFVEPIAFGNGMHGVKSKPVEPVVEQPVERVLGKEPADLRTPKIDGRAPRRGDVVAKHFRRQHRQIVSVRSEVIVNDVKEDHEPVPMCCVDQRTQFVRRAVAALRRVGQGAVVAPVACTREFRDRHEFDRCNAKFGEPLQFPRDAGVAAEKPCVELVQHGLVPGASGPLRIAPLVGRGIHHDAGAVDIAVLSSRSWVGYRRAVRQQVAIARSGAASGLGFEPSITGRLHGNGISAIDGNRHALLCGRPDAKSRSLRSNQVGAKRRAPSHAVHCNGLSGLE